MEFYTHFNRAKERFLQALLVQLFLVSVSFPVLVAWGIPFSPLVLVSTLIFTPFLTVFLALSCIIFVLELLYIPNTLFCALLELVTTVWLWCLQAAPEVRMIACPLAPWWILILMPLGALIIIKQLGFKQLVATHLFLCVWITCCFFGIKYFFTRDVQFFIPCGSKQIECRMQQHKIHIIDTQHALESRSASIYWCDYTFSSELAKKCGATHIDTLTVARVTEKNRETIERFCKKYHGILVYTLDTVQQH